MEELPMEMEGNNSINSFGMAKHQIVHWMEGHISADFLTASGKISIRTNLKFDELK